MTAVQAPAQDLGHTLLLWPGDLWPGYVIAGAVAMFVGVADILSRYKDNPLAALRTSAARYYCLANGALGVAAFWLAFVLNVIDVKGAPGGHGLSVESVRSGLIVGFGATIILRAVAFKFSVGGKTSEVGPSTIVDALLATLDQSIDRTVGAAKDRAVREMMAGLSFEKCKGFIPEYCLSLMSDNKEKAARVGELVGSISKFKKDDDPTADAERAFLLGNTLINAFGYPVTRAVVAGFREQMLLTAPAPAQPAPNPDAPALPAAGGPPAPPSGGPAPAARQGR